MKMNRILFQIDGQATCEIDRKYGPSSSFDEVYDLIPSIYLNIYGIQCEEDEDANIDQATLIGKLNGNIIMIRQMIEDGYDPYILCDDESADLEYAISSLSESGPLNEFEGDPEQNILYVDELEWYSEKLSKKIQSDIYGALPLAVYKLFHVKPDILAYIPRMLPKADDNVSEFDPAIHNEDYEINYLLGRRQKGSIYPSNRRNMELFDYYRAMGFKEAGGTGVLYRCIRWKV